VFLFLLIVYARYKTEQATDRIFTQVIQLCLPASLMESSSSSYVGQFGPATIVRITKERSRQYVRCLIFLFLTVTLGFLLDPFHGVSNYDHSKLDGQGRSFLKKSSNTHGSVVSTSSSSDPWSLRCDWGNLDLMSPFANQMSAHQRNCSLPLVQFEQRDEIGIGSDLHVWTQALCNAMELQRRLYTPTPWEDAGPNGTCNSGGTAQSAINCLFPRAELLCPHDVTLITSSSNNTSNIPWLPLYGVHGHLIKGRGFRKSGKAGVPDQWACNRTLSRGNYSRVDVRTAGIEYLFSKITADVVREAKRQLMATFPDGVPRDLITVHVRWGDKRREMELVSIENYTLAIQNLLEHRPTTTNSRVNIFLATEDPRAAQQFRKVANRLNWTLFVDPYVDEMKSYYRTGTNNNPKMTKELQGRPAISALVSLLLSLEANYYVLTTKSNWSRMINELRQAVIDPRCGNCTVMTDLSPDIGWR
jgi:hypothetical protein